MYLHLGQDYIISEKDIIGIFDIDTSSVSKITRHFLTLAENAKEIINITNDIPKSFVLCGSKDGAIIYVTQISSATLKKRLEHFEEIK